MNVFLKTTTWAASAFFKNIAFCVYIRNIITAKGWFIFIVELS